VHWRAPRLEQAFEALRNYHDLQSVHKGLKKRLDRMAPKEDEFVFPSRVKGRPFAGLPKACRRVRRGTKVAHLTPHGLRHAYASVASDLGYAEPTIAALLGHATGTTTSRYIHHLDAALIAARRHGLRPHRFSS
jgi:integrase